MGRKIIRKKESKFKYMLRRFKKHFSKILKLIGEGILIFINEILKSLKLKESKSYKHFNRKDFSFTSLQSDNELRIKETIKGLIITIIIVIFAIKFMIWLFPILIKSSPIFN